MKDNPERLMELSQEAGFSVAEPVYSESQGRRYLVVFQSARLLVKFSNDGTDLFVWVTSRPSGEATVWHGIRPIGRILREDHKIDYDPFPSFGTVEGIARFFIHEHDKIVSLFSSCTRVELASRVRLVEEQDRADALRSLGIDYKPQY